MIRPIETRIYRPERRFGWGVMILGEDIEGAKYLLNFRAEPGSPEEWVKLEKNAASEPIEGTTWFVDDVVLQMLSCRWMEVNPPPAAQPSIQDLLMSDLGDARAVRDKLLDVVVKVASEA